MCLLAIQYKSVPEAPILVAANREEAYDRPTLVPSIQPGKPRVLLCRDLLRANSARHAVDIALEELSANKYEGVNFIIADYESGWAVHGGDDPHVVELIEGLNIISNFDLNDPRDERQ